MHPYDRRNLEAELFTLLDSMTDTAYVAGMEDEDPTFVFPDYHKTHEAIMRLFAEAYSS